MAEQIPLFSHVEGNLWLGGYDPTVRLGSEFGSVVGLYPFRRYHTASEVVHLRAGFFDLPRPPHPSRAYRTARWALAAAERGPVLIHCAAGFNRSGLITGLALVLRGMPPVEAIELLRERRHPRVLDNRHFERWLLERAGHAC